MPTPVKEIQSKIYQNGELLDIKVQTHPSKQWRIDEEGNDVVRIIGIPSTNSVFRPFVFLPM